jgi:hypothetical protein
MPKVPTGPAHKDCLCERLWPRTGLSAPASVAIGQALPLANPLRLLAVSYSAGSATSAVVRRQGQLAVAVRVKVLPAAADKNLEALSHACPR